jgi:predicted transcriptional regulator of viral defense system
MRAREVRQLLADMAHAQRGVVTAVQARAAGITYVRLTRMSQSGTLRRLAHGVYLVEGAEPDEHRDLRAAWLALEPSRTGRERLADGAAGAVVSHGSASALHGSRPAGTVRHEFTVPGRKQSRRRDVRLHRGSLIADDITTVDGLPVTTAERTIVDLVADSVELDVIAALVRTARHRYGLDVEDLADRLEPYAARRGFPDRDGIGLLRHLCTVPALEIIG